MKIKIICSVLLVSILIFAGCSPDKTTPKTTTPSLPINERVQILEGNYSSLANRVAILDAKVTTPTDKLTGYTYAMTSQGLHIEFPSEKGSTAFEVRLIPNTQTSAGKVGDSYEVALKSVYNSIIMNRAYSANIYLSGNQWYIYDLKFIAYPISLSAGKVDLLFNIPNGYDIYAQRIDKVN